MENKEQIANNLHTERKRRNPKGQMSFPMPTELRDRLKAASLQLDLPMAVIVRQAIARELTRLQF